MTTVKASDMEEKEKGYSFSLNPALVFKSVELRHDNA
jgi:hypothetical protein